MPLAQNQSTLDYAGVGYPWVVTLAKNSIDPDGLDLTYGGAPFYSSLGEVSTSNMLATQLVVEMLRDATDPGGGNLRSTEVATEWLVQNSETIYVTTLVLERLSRSASSLSNVGLGRSWMVFDETNHLDIYLAHGTAPSSAADKVAVLNGTNLALWGREIIGFRDVTSLGSNRYRLSCLIRGRFGTEWAMNTHTTADEFIMLSTTTVGRITQDEVDIGVNKFYRALTIGQLITQGQTRGFANQAVGMKPYAPCHVTGSRDGSNNLTIVWVRRARYGAEWNDGSDIGIGEESEAYEVDILDGSGTVVRTITGLTSPTASYTAAQQTTDFGGVQSSIAVIVYQLSGVVGRGYGTNIVL